MKRSLAIVMGFLVYLFLGGLPVSANLTYGSGYYTNLCDSGTAAKYYSCDPGCNPVTGSCQSGNSGVVKWSCSGKWDQCLASETGWNGYQDVTGTACGTTVQLSLFDKKCRRDDGSWDNSCRLLGYMVWYSGDCSPGYVKTAPVPLTVTPTVKALAIAATATLAPTIKPTVTPKVTVTTTVVPTAVSKLAQLVSPTPIPTINPALKVCGKTCRLDSDCQIGFVCASGGVCRNPACIADTGCFCGQVAGAVAAKTPDTGETSWWGAVGLLLAGVLGVYIRKQAKKVW